MSSTESINSKVLVVEDDEALRELIREELVEQGYAVLEAANIREALQSLRQYGPKLLVSDLRLPDGDGLLLLSQARAMSLPPGFIVITAFGTVEQAVAALQQGADDFLTKPLNLDHLSVAVRRALERQLLHEEISRYKRALDHDDFHGLIGRSPAMRNLFEQIRRIARANGPVLLRGESGVGKELVARAIHQESERSEGPFIAVNCAGIPPDLLESELFGHSANAFTGAGRGRKGLFGEAENGTLLLDEIGEMPSAMQSKLLRVLQDGHLRPVGEDRERQVDTRVIAATNRDLEAEIESGGFREDLFYRLETFVVEIPSLRHRDEDVELLAAHFVARFSAAAGRTVATVSADALRCLRSYPFPGNVRELSNAIERAVAFATSEEIAVEDLPDRIRQNAIPPAIDIPAMLFTQDEGNHPAHLPTLREIDTRYVHFVLEKCEGNKRQAAERLGIGRRTLYRYLDEPEV